MHPIGEIQAFSVWNQYKNEAKIFQATLHGLDTDLVNSQGQLNMPDLHHKWFILDNSAHSNNKFFMMVSYSMDLNTCEWTAVLIQVYDIASGKVYNDIHN